MENIYLKKLNLCSVFKSFLNADSTSQLYTFFCDESGSSHNEMISPQIYIYRTGENFKTYNSKLIIISHGNGHFLPDGYYNFLDNPSIEFGEEKKPFQ